MMNLTKIKHWIDENAPMLAKVYQNKYVAMGYDRFASLPSSQQKRVLQGIFIGGSLFIVLILLSSYITLWSFQSQTRQYSEMVTMLQDYQKSVRDKSGTLQILDKNAQLSDSNLFKQYLQEQGRNASISPRMIQVEEKSTTELGAKEGKESKKVMSVKLQKVNLEQLRNFLQNVEYGSYKLWIQNFRLNNDDKLRGYMNVDVVVEAPLFNFENNS
jgi:hypothetical protein